MTTRTCAHHGCNATFTPTRASRRFCTPQCARRARTLRENQQLAPHDGIHAYTSRTSCGGTGKQADRADPEHGRIPY